MLKVPNLLTNPCVRACFPWAAHGCSVAAESGLYVPQTHLPSIPVYITYIKSYSVSTQPCWLSLLCWKRTWAASYFLRHTGWDEYFIYVFKGKHACFQRSIVHIKSYQLKLRQRDIRLLHFWSPRVYIWLRRPLTCSHQHCGSTTSVWGGGEPNLRPWGSLPKIYE